MTKTCKDITRVADNNKKLLIKKNIQYGDSALEPIGIFSQGGAVASLGARMDDKLMRLKAQGINGDSLDTLYDLQGYITLLIIAVERSESIDSMSKVIDDDSNTMDIINS
tara:strand:- start:590 stop:919 length:330 start_codon:yes stop_codon:yes gene_type:complete